MLTRKALIVVLMAFVLLPSAQAAPNRRNQIRYRFPGVVKRAALGNTSPSVAVTSPTVADGACTTTEPTITVSGTATANTGIVSVEWVLSHGGSSSHGVCVGTENWEVTDLALSLGVSELSVVAKDSLGNTGVANLEITRSDGIPPVIDINYPTDAPTCTVHQPSVTLGGTVQDADVVRSIGAVSNRGINGTWDYYSAITGEWSLSIDLLQGSNLITVTATDGSGASASDILEVVYADALAPTIVPMDERTVNSQTTELYVMAYDDNEMSTVTWYSDTGDSGICTRTEYAEYWHAAGVRLEPGPNIVTFSAQDSSGNVASTTVIVNCLPSAPGDAWKGLSLVSVPVFRNDEDPKASVGFYEDQWLTYVDGKYARYPDRGTFFYQLEGIPPRGYWAYFADPAPAYPCGEVLSQKNSVDITLDNGWNLIGQPFLFAVDWDLDDIQVGMWGDWTPLRDSSVLVDTYAWGWDNVRGEYYLVADTSEVTGAVGQLDPWRGYWIRAKMACDLRLPAPQITPAEAPVGASAGGK